MTKSKRDLLLITGIPGTGKTTFANTLASQFSFVHYDLEEPQILNRLAANPVQFISEILGQKKDIVVTWGFVPDNQPSVAAVLQFRDSGFKLIWFDGNRAAGLREFKKRGTVPEELFHVQMDRIENNRVIEVIKPVIVNSFDAEGRFKSASDLLQEIRNA